MPTLCIAFDLDDTLYLERDYVRSGFESLSSWALVNLGIEHFAEKAWRLFEQGERGSIFDSVFRESGIEPESLTVQEMVRIYRSHEPSISMLPDASACLQKLRGRAVLGLISDGPLASQQAKSRKLGLYDLFQSVILTDQWGSQYCKPHLRAFQFFQDQVRSKQGRFVYVADNPAKDFSAPLALGWETVRVRRPDGLHFLKQAVPAAQPGFEIGDLSKLCSVLHVDCP